MDLFAASSGLVGLLSDAREFFAAVRLARPGALWLGLLVPVFGVLNRWAARRRAGAVEAIGRPAAVAGQLTHPRPRHRWLGLAYPLAWALLVLGIAGPRWGISQESGVAVGRDLVIVIDLSRSMQAADMNTAEAKTRWEAARAGALELVKAVARRGGHRVAVVVFAARPKLVCPLTTDYEHARAILEDLDGERPPPDVRPGNDPDVFSGTRIGTALILAVETHDEQFLGSQDVILISDGDDPARDGEWLRGAARAAEGKVPVHTVGVGGSVPAELKIAPDAPDLPPPTTRLDEEVLKTIARDTGGHYVAARTSVPPLGEFFRARIEPNRSREYSGDQVPQPKERYVWFLAPALALFAVGWLRGK
ncbi:MAG: VWA domain-containing protein [Planctomycetes bacterium]|nr:VWA domain-containing protein [Planctomycetota bacterium]